MSTVPEPVPRRDGTRAWLVRAPLAALAAGGCAALLAAWGVPVAETSRLAIATVALVVLPGWALTAPLARLLSPADRAICAGVLGLVTTALVHYLWNTHLAARPSWPGTDAALRAWCAAAALGVIGAAWRGRARRRAPRPDEARWRGALVAVALAAVPALFPFADPNGRIDDDGISFDMDELTHFYLVGSMLRPGPPSVSTLADFPMPPYQFAVPSLTAAYLRLVDVDPIHLQCRWLPLLTFALIATSAAVLARRALGSPVAAIAAALALFYAGDAATTWGLVGQTHSAVAYATFVVATFLALAALDERDASPETSGRAAVDGASTAAMIASGWLFASLFQSKAPLFFTSGAALGWLALVRIVTRRDPRPLVALAAMVAATCVIASDRWGSVRHSPLRIAPGSNLAAALAMLPPPWGKLGASPALAFVAGLPLVALVVGNVRWLGLRSAWRARHERPGLASAPHLLGAASLAGLVAANLVYEPDNPGGLAPLWFAQHPLLVVSQLVAGIGCAAIWPRRRVAIAAATAAVALTVLATVSLGVGDEPQRFERAERDCGEWLRRHTPVDARVIHDPERTGLPIFSLRPSILALEPILRGDKPNGIAPPAYMAALTRAVEERRATLARFLTTTDATEAHAVAERLGAGYLFLGRNDRLALDPERAFGAPLTTCGDGGRIFALATSSE